ncbi:MAG: hypothetical protein AB7O52_15055 [Planctomycetota bacterium]
MIEPRVPPERPTNGRGPHSPAADDEDLALGELRALLLAPEQERIEQLRQRLDDPDQRARELAATLPDAVELSIRDDHRLSQALAPTVEDTLHISVKKDPQGLVDALSPVMMPAIRKSIADTIKSMVQALNETLERSLSAQGLRWRLEALRTGRPFAEVVMLRSLRFRVEQVYLMHRRTGLLLHHEAIPGLDVESPDLVSGMLTAIQDFVRDSFGARDSETLDALEVGDHTVWIEAGPHALLAAVIRGSAPRTLRDELQATLAAVHREWGEALAEFRGDDAPFAATGARLRDCLLEARAESTAAKRRRLSPALVIAVAVVSILVVSWSYATWRQAQRISALRERLDATPGVVVLDLSQKDGKYWIRGLRDPYASRAEDALIALGLQPADFSIDLRAYASLDPGLTLARARAVLAPPASVELTLVGGRLQAHGAAPHAWIERARVQATALPYVDSLEVSDLADLDLQALEARARAVEATIIDDLPALVPTLADSGTAGQAPPLQIRDLVVRLIALAEEAYALDQRTEVRLTVTEGTPHALQTQRWTHEIQRLCRLEERGSSGLEVRASVRALAADSDAPVTRRLIVAIQFHAQRNPRVDEP